ncbi:MAG: nuclear transport factor 2 family protein [Bacteroidota bacterium]
MKSKNLIIAFLSLMFFSLRSYAHNEADPIKEVKKVAEAFIKVVDKHNASELKALLHPNMVQFVRMGEKLIPMTADAYIQMTVDKKIGGIPRKITHKSANIIRGETADVVLKAVSEEYDFMYQLSLAKNGNDWVIVGILVDILKV